MARNIQSAAVRVSPLSPLGRDTATRGPLMVEALIQGYYHYGQVVAGLRMNGVVPPASRS